MKLISDFSRDFILGLSLPFKALVLLLRKPKLLLWSLIPITIACILYATIFTALLYPGREAITSFLQNYLNFNLFGTQGIVSTVAGWIASVLLTIALIVVMGFAFGSSVNLISLPINDFLAQAAEVCITPPLNRPASAGWRHEIKLILIDLRKNILSILGLIICFVLAFVPIVNFLAFPLSWIFFASQYVSYPQTRRQIGAIQGFKWLFKYLGLSLGFGLILAVGFSAPLLGIVLHPLGIIGGVIAFGKKRE